MVSVVEWDCWVEIRGECDLVLVISEGRIPLEEKGRHSCPMSKGWRAVQEATLVQTHVACYLQMPLIVVP